MKLEIEQILVTSEAGDTLTPRPDLLRPELGTGGGGDSATLTIFPEKIKQTLEGIGTSFTEASAFVLAHLEPAKRREVMERIFGPEGANFSMARTHIGSCDFTVEGRYCYQPTPASPFSIGCDQDGFDPSRHPGIKDPAYDLLPMIREALELKGGEPLKIIGSAWTAPPWMKDTGEWFTKGSEANNFQGDGGRLLAEHYGSYAKYLVDYLAAYEEKGVSLWGLTPVNEPDGNNGQWESMHFTPQTQARFIGGHLGPALGAAGFGGVKLLGFDQNRDHMEQWARGLYGDPEARGFLHGLAVHWYSSTYKVYEEGFDRIRAAFPDKAIIHTEGCIDDLGNDPPPGVTDPEVFKESGWFGNDSFWWNENATDWGYATNWEGIDASDHPIYTPVHRYARDIIVGINHGLSGWIDWNIVLDSRGGPNHVGNYCGAPIMIDRSTGQIHYTPCFQILAQLSRTIRPGDRAVGTALILNGTAKPDNLRCCATLGQEGVMTVQLLNTLKASQLCTIETGGRRVAVKIPANALQTVRILP